MAEQASQTEMLQFKPNGRVPNSRFPVLIHRAAIKAGPGEDMADAIEATFRRNDWLLSAGAVPAGLALPDPAGPIAGARSSRPGRAGGTRWRPRRVPLIPACATTG